MRRTIPTLRRVSSKLCGRFPRKGGSDFGAGHGRMRGSRRSCATAPDPCAWFLAGYLGYVRGSFFVSVLGFVGVAALAARHAAGAGRPNRGSTPATIPKLGLLREWIESLNSRPRGRLIFIKQRWRIKKRSFSLTYRPGFGTPQAQGAHSFILAFSLFVACRPIPYETLTEVSKIWIIWQCQASRSILHLPCALTGDREDHGWMTD